MSSITARIRRFLPPWLRPRAGGLGAVIAHDDSLTERILALVEKELGKPLLEVFERFDDIVLSGEHGIGKPQAEIYHLVCERSGIAPSDAVFLDDSPANVAGAHAVGMGAHLFTDAAQARLDLRADGFGV